MTRFRNGVHAIRGPEIEHASPVTIALGVDAGRACPAVGMPPHVTIDLLIRAVRASLGGCAAAG
jgi:hypothetical protein